jgi:serine-type D-Ala-D-Ala carboxypeptidase (penicillin-binding protein 5/6)
MLPEFDTRVPANRSPETPFGHKMIYQALKRGLLLVAGIFIVFLLQVTPSFAGYAHFLIDANNNKVLAQDGADALNHPASLTKMMTLYMVFEALHDGRLKWDQRIPITANAFETIPMKFALPVGATFTVREAVMGMIVLSANDAAEAMGDYLAGDEVAFGKAMTERAHQLGMASTTFRNASGLPDDLQVTTARDMATLGLALMRDFPEEYKLFATHYFTFRGIKFRGHNNLMYRYKGMDGIKTGYIDASGYNIVTAVNAGGKHVVGVVFGGKTARIRDDRMAELMDAALIKASVNVSQATAIAETGDDAGVVVQPLQTANVQVSSANQGGWEIQIAAASTQSEALSLLSKALNEINQQFPTVKPYAVRVKSGTRILYRARLTGFDDQTAAASACTRLKQRSYDCMAVAGKK